MTRYAGLFVVGAVLAVIVALVVGFLSVDVPSSEVEIPLSDLSEELSYRDELRIPIFIDRHGHDVTVFSARSTHLGQPVSWCVQERMFFEPRAASRWDAKGRRVPGSPAPRDLDRFRAHVDGPSVVVDLAGLITGRPAGLGIPGAVSAEWSLTGGRCADRIPSTTT